MFFQKKEQKDICLLHKKISFSQSGEDLIVDFIFRNLMKIDMPSYIDVGAYDPFVLNNTAIFYSRGCRGVNVEPNPSAIDKFIEARPFDININIGISDMEGFLDYYRFKGPALNTFDENEKEKNIEQYTGKLTIQITTLTGIINKYCKGIFPDFLSLDVEGFDMKILQTIDYNNAPKVICVETIQKAANQVWVKNSSIINFLKAKGYLHHSDTCINSIFVLNTALKEIVLEI